MSVGKYEGVFMEWSNPPGTASDLLIQSTLNWFDADGRLWFVQGAEPLDALMKIAESIQP